MPVFFLQYNKLNNNLLKVAFLCISIFLKTNFTYALDQSYLDDLVQRSKNLKLSDEREWRILLHYSPNQFSKNFHSLVDDELFFLAKDGVNNPQDELEATLKGFFDKEVVETDQLQHPQCRFAARYYWLNQMLKFDNDKIIPQTCKRFEEWKDALRPKGATLVFPAAYLNNPASMFGHTLLRIDGEGQDKDSRLLAYGASYAANTNESSGFIFAVNGIFGGYSGAFTIGTYYKVVKLYSDLENRDIWEYQLDFTEHQVEMLIRHLWELRITNFDYYFFDENCSYHLLSLFEAANPSLELSSKFNFWAIPSDTVKVVVEQDGFVKNIAYRPSNSTKLKVRVQNSSELVKDFAIDIAEQKINLNDSKLNALSEQDKAETFDLSYEYLNYLRESGKDLTAESAELGFNLLKERSKLKVGRTDPNYESFAEKPELGHETGMIAVSGGVEDSNSYYDILYRPAYHDMMAKSYGYSEYSELKFFETSFRHYENDQFKLQNLTPLSIVSLAPRDDFFRPMSWRVGVSIDRQNFNNDDSRKLIYKFGGGSGLAYKLADDLLGYSLLLTKFELSESYDQNYALAPGAEIGLIYDINEEIRTKLTYNFAKFILGEEYNYSKVSIETYYSIDKDNQVGLNLYQQNTLDSNLSGYQFIFRRFF